MRQLAELGASECVQAAGRKIAPRYTELHKMVEIRRNGSRVQENDTDCYVIHETDFEASDVDWEQDRGSASGRSSPREVRKRPPTSYVAQVPCSSKLVWRREAAQSAVPLLCLMGDSQLRPALLPKCVASVECLPGLRAEQLTWIIESRGRAHSPPPLVMLHVGGNNLASDSCQLLVARLVDLLHVARAAFPGSVVFINGVLRRPDSSAALVSRVNSLVRQHCDRSRAVFIDTNKFVYEWHFDRDGVHLNAEGRIALYKMIARVMDIVLK